MAAMQTHWKVPAIQVRTSQYPHRLEPDLVQFNVERILKLRRTQGRGGNWVVATVWGSRGLRDITWKAASGLDVCQSGHLIRSADDKGPTSNKPQGGGTPGETMVTSVVRLDQVDPDINLLKTVPCKWLPLEGAGEAENSAASSVDWVERFDLLWLHLSRPMRAWFNAVFWDQPWRLYGFLTAPASMRHHHARPHGLFIHSVDCAWRALQGAQADDLVDTDVLTLAALLHDVGKAAEYAWNQRKQCWKLSDRGALMGHRLTGLEWMAAARVVLPQTHAPTEQTVMAVYHAIHASHAPEWVGLRTPRTLEAHYLASVDSLSGHSDLVHTHALPGRTQGRYHPAFRGGPFVSSCQPQGGTRCV